MPARPKLIFLVTEDWYFWSHRLPMARAAREAGFDVAVATRIALHGDRIRAEGFAIHPLQWRRRSLGLVASLAAIAEIYRLYRRERPFIAHHVSLKPAMLGGVAALLAGVPAVISMITGTGYVGGSRSWRARAIGRMTRPLWPVLLLRRNCRVIVQNEDDRGEILGRRPEAAAQISVIPGSGVDLDYFRPEAEPPAPPVVVAYVGRMIAIKGVALLVEAQQILWRRGLDLRLLLAGAPDPENPSSLAAGQLAQWQALPGITWLGHVEDVRVVWRQAHIAALASQGGEGLPKNLLEAAAMGRAIVATDVAGTRDIARRGVNALLVPPGDATAFADALAALAGDGDARVRFACAGRHLVETEFSDRKIAAMTLGLYRELLVQITAAASSMTKI